MVENSDKPLEVVMEKIIVNKTRMIKLTLKKKVKYYFIL